MSFSDELSRAFADARPASTIEPGWYFMRAIAASECTAGTGTQGLHIELAIVSGTVSGVTLHHTFWLSEKSLPYVKRDLSALGLGDEPLDELVARQSFADALITPVLLAYTEFNGRRRLSVVEFKRAPVEDEGPQSPTQVESRA